LAVGEAGVQSVGQGGLVDADAVCLEVCAGDVDQQQVLGVGMPAE
jgi:hypothetical protein